MQINTYIYGLSFYHRFDIRAKLLFSILISISIFFVDRWYGLFVVAVSFIFVSFISVGLKESWNGFKRLIPILFFLVVLSPLQNRDGQALLLLGDFVLVTKDALITVFRVGMRFISISYAYMLLIETERSERIVEALEWFKLPYNIALLFSLVLRFIPYFGSLYEDIRLSMSLRLKEGKRGYPVLPTITALTVSAIKMVPNTASALEERGFGLGLRIGETQFSFSFTIFAEISFSIILPILLAFML